MKILSSLQENGILVDKIPEKLTNSTSEDKPDKEKLELIKISPGLFEFQIFSSQSGILVIPENWDKGWQLYVNDGKQDTVRVNMAYLGVPIQSGQSDIILRYRDVYLYKGCLIALGTFIALCMLCLFSVKSSNTMKYGRLFY